MQSNGKRRAKLALRVGELQVEIERLKLQSKVLDLASKLQSKEFEFRPLSEREWKLLSPSEQRKQLPFLYLTLRLELIALREQMDKAKERGRLTEWLDSPVVRVIELSAAVAALTDLAIHYGWEALRIVGLGAGPDEEDEEEAVSYVV